MTRRELLARTAGIGALGLIASREPAAAAGGTGTGPTARTAAAGAATDQALLRLSAREAVGRVHRGELTAERYAQALLAQCARGAALNAFITLEPQKVLEAARACDRQRSSGARLGPLHGLPVPVKDSVNTAELPTTAGTAALRHFRPATDAPLVAALRAAGAIVLGKTNLHELSWGYTSNNHAFGAVHNPYDPTRIPGGSSGGTAAAIAFHMAPLGVAEDTEGSIRVPAALCGIAGFRPTTGRYSTQGCAPISPLFDQVGPHARSVADLALFDEVLQPAAAPLVPAKLEGLKLGVVRSYWYEGLDPEVARVTEAALGRLRAAGVELVEGELPGLEHLISLTTDAVQNHDTRPALTRYLAEYHAGVSFEQLLALTSADLRAMLTQVVNPGGRDYVSDAQYAEITRVHLPQLRALYRDYFARSGVAALVFPATMIPALRIGDENEIVVAGHRLRFDAAIARNIAPGSTAGIPGLVLPAGLTGAGLPVALEFDGPAGSDRALLALGLALEPVLGTLPPPPGTAVPA